MKTNIHNTPEWAGIYLYAHNICMSDTYETWFGYSIIIYMTEKFEKGLHYGIAENYDTYSITRINPPKWAAHVCYCENLERCAVRILEDLYENT